MAGAVINIILNFLLIPLVGTNGAAIATALSYLAIFIYRYYDTKRYIKIQIVKKKYLFTVLFLFLLLISGYMSDKLISITCLVEFGILCVIQKDLIVQTLETIRQVIHNKR